MRASPFRATGSNQLFKRDEGIFVREIKFRAWDEVHKQMLYIGLELDTHIGGPQEDLMQYTGLKDKNGVEIYEGDIVRGTYEEFSDYDHEEYTIEFVSQLTFENGAFCIKRDYVNFEGRMRGPSLNKHWDSEKVAVIGNAFENPELLEDTQ